MNRTAALLLLALPLAAPALAVPGGDIGTLATGHYRCELPGDAAGPAGIAVPQRDFSVLNASSYASAAGGGNYLLTGDTITMTSGPLKGQRFRRVSTNFLREIGPDGADGPLRCIRGGANR